MDQGLHPDLENQLQDLAGRIARLRRTTGAKDEKSPASAATEALEQRYETLAKRLQALKREGPSFRREAKAELERMAEDLRGTVEDFVRWADAGYRGRGPAATGR